MNWQNSILLIIITNCISGSFAYICWKIFSVILSKFKLYTVCSKLFSLMVVFWIFPLVFVVLFIKNFQLTGVTDIWFESIPAKYVTTLLYFWLVGASILILCIIFALYKIKYKPIYFKHKNISLAIKIADDTIMNAWLTDKGDDNYIYPGFTSGESVQVYCTSVPVPLVKVGRAPSIYLPAVDYSDQDLSIVVFHELSHIMRGDLNIRSCILWIQIIFWFNPLVYLLINDFEQWSETACDIDVCSGRFGDISKINYLNILLQNTSQWTKAIPKDTFAKNYFVSHLSPDGKRLKMRITRLMEYNYKENQRETVRIIGTGYMILTLVIILAVSFLMETNILDFIGWL